MTKICTIEANINIEGILAYLSPGQTMAYFNGENL